MVVIVSSSMMMVIAVIEYYCIGVDGGCGVVLAFGAFMVVATKLSVFPAVRCGKAVKAIHCDWVMDRLIFLWGQCGRLYWP